MEYVTYEFTNDIYAPAIVRIGEASTPVWRQQRWDTGEYKEFIQRNGCGHCCTAMAARLHGVDIDPYMEFDYCRSHWGAPGKEEPIQGNWISLSGVVKVLAHFKINAECFGVPIDGEKSAVEHILKSLSQGKQVIFWSEPSERFPENPFSKGAHYVFAVGYNEEGKIVIANSSEKWTPDGIQLVDAATIGKALFLGSDPLDMTWGEPGRRSNSAGYVVIDNELLNLKG